MGGDTGRPRNPGRYQPADPRATDRDRSPQVRVLRDDDAPAARPARERSVRPPSRDEAPSGLEAISTTPRIGRGQPLWANDRAPVDPSTGLQYPDEYGRGSRRVRGELYTERYVGSFAESYEGEREAAFQPGVPVYDEPGYDEPVYDESVEELFDGGYDEYGDPIVVDRYGRRVLVDEYGYPVAYTAAAPVAAGSPAGQSAGPGGGAEPSPKRMMWAGLAVLTATIGLVSLLGGGSDDAGPATSTTAKNSSVATTTTAAPVSTTSTLPPDGKTAAQRTMTQVTKITEGGLRPKSVVYSGGEYFFAQNMMYAHTVTVYDRSFRLVKTIPDSVDLASFGHQGYVGAYQGAPVEAAFTSDGKYAYISQYQMYGSGFDNPGSDSCPGSGNDDSFVYRISTATLTIDQVIKVGAVPKYVAVSPDNTKVLVTNWCTYDMSIIDVASGVEISRVKLGRYPRGVVISPDSTTAYVAIMGGTDIAIVNLATNVVDWIPDVGDSPRHLVLSPDGTTIYATLNGDGKVAKIDVATRAVVARKTTGAAPRSMAISDDGTALYVVNYNEDTVSKIAASDLSEITKLPTDHHPIGITYDPVARQVWVACYVGSLIVFNEA